MGCVTVFFIVGVSRSAPFSTAFLAPLGEQASVYTDLQVPWLKKVIKVCSPIEGVGLSFSIYFRPSIAIEPVSSPFCEEGTGYNAKEMPMSRGKPSRYQLTIDTIHRMSSVKLSLKVLSGVDCSPRPSGPTSIPKERRSKGVTSPPCTKAMILEMTVSHHILQGNEQPFAFVPWIVPLNAFVRSAGPEVYRMVTNIRSSEPRFRPVHCLAPSPSKGTRSESSLSESKNE